DFEHERGSPRQDQHNHGPTRRRRGDTRPPGRPLATRTRASRSDRSGPTKDTGTSRWTPFYGPAGEIATALNGSRRRDNHPVPNRDVALAASWITSELGVEMTSPGKLRPPGRSLEARMHDNAAAGGSPAHSIRLRPSRRTRSCTVSGRRLARGYSSGSHRAGQEPPQD